jgi:hypothetical protein
MENIDGVVVRPVEDPKWITHDSRGPDFGALRDTWRSFGRAADAINDTSNRRPIDLAIAGLALAV